MSKQLVFVYGSLKKGYGNHSVMERSAGRLLGEATLPPRYKLFSLGGFPGVVEVDEDGNELHGEVYEVERMNSLDALEGHPEFYRRKLVNTEYGEAWVYLLPDHWLDGRDIITDGKW